MMFISNCSKLCLIAIAGLLPFAAPAFAQEATISSRAVHTNDLDLRTDNGATMLRHRVTLAAMQVCGPAEMIGSPDYASYDQCVTAAEQQASNRSDAMIASARDLHRYASATPPE